RQLANPHVAVVGVTGSGKSFFLKTFLTKANFAWGTKALILDWSGEYAQWVKQAGGKVIQLGKEPLNVLDLGGMTPFQRIQQLVRSLSMLADIRDPVQKQWLQLALESAYQRKGFLLSRQSQKNPPTLKDVLAWLKTKSKKQKVEELSLQLRFLCSGGNDFFARQSSLRLDEFFSSSLVCVDLTALPSESFRSLTGLTILQFARERMRMSGVHEEKKLEQFIVLDEAWKICAEESDPVALVREGRKHAFGLIVATQNPCDVSKTILSNVGSLFVFRTPYSESLDQLQSSLRFPDSFRQRFSGLRTGECGVHLLWDKGGSHTFFLNRVEGEELLKTCTFEVDKMSWQMEKTLLLQLLQQLGVKSEEADSWLCSRGYKADMAEFCLFLDAHCSAKEQKVFLRKLGLDEKQVNCVFSAKKHAASPKNVRWARVEA
ncbi:DUF87 domain-containing protein, partial [Candidatus Micrarchaeota archaeon]|nr:DUF87 domain-containing protein [Candidatus Micrarchaeota archaeon]